MSPLGSSIRSLWDAFYQNRAKLSQELVNGTLGIELASDALACEPQPIPSQTEFIEDQVLDLEFAIRLAMEEPHRATLRTL